VRTFVAVYSRAFTLIELLIVVAIIGILAAIAVPNFLNAQVRAKIAGTVADQRSLSTAFETYRLDNNMYPPTPDTAAHMRFARLAKLTSPVAYMSTVPFDPFASKIFTDVLERVYPFWDPEKTDNVKNSAYFTYLPEERQRSKRWMLHGAGPDQDYEASTEMGGQGILIIYEATNGVTSEGDIYRFGP
jgi:type II secretion system protein G